MTLRPGKDKVVLHYSVALDGNFIILIFYICSLVAAEGQGTCAVPGGMQDDPSGLHSRRL